MPKYENKVGFSFTDGLRYPIEEIIKKGREFILLVGVVSLITTVVTLVCGRGFICGFPDKENIIFCSYKIPNVCMALLASLYGIIFVIGRWQKITEQNQTFYEAAKGNDWKRNTKIFLFLCLYCLLWGLFVGLISFLNARTPSADWEVEIAVFTFFAAIIVLVFWGLVNSYVFIRFLNGQTCWIFQKTFWLVFDNVYKFISWFLLYLLFFTMLIYEITIFFGKGDMLPAIVNGFIGEFVYNIILYTAIIVFVSVLTYQAKQIEKALEN